MNALLLWIEVAALGAAGSLLRFFVDRTVTRRAGRDFPFGTLIVNLSGALVLGFLVGLGLGGNRFLLLGTATIGSYTTFSTWMLETQRLAEEGEFGGAAGNVAFSLAVGLVAAALGRMIGRHL
jgi:CrcB protein